MCQTFDGNLYLTRDLMEGSCAPQNLKVPKVKDVPAAPPKKAKKAAKPGEHVQLFKVQYDRKRNFYTTECEIAPQFALVGNSFMKSEYL